MKKVLVAFAGLMIGAFVMFGAVEAGRADAIEVDTQIDRNARAIEANRVLIAQADVDAGVIAVEPAAANGSAPDAGSASAPVVAPSSAPASSQTSAIDPPAPDISTVQQLWRTGALLGAGVVALFLLLTTLVKLDPKRALYWTAGVTSLAAVVDTTIGTGVSPNLSMLVVAGVTFLGIVVKGPQANTNQAA